MADEVQTKRAQTVVRGQVEEQERALSEETSEEEMSPPNSATSMQAGAAFVMLDSGDSHRGSSSVDGECS